MPRSPMREPVVNSTPLITLCNIGRIDLLRALYTTVHIPRAVFDEVTSKKDSACELLLSKPDWICVSETPEPDDERLMRARLHAGEVGVIMLAREIGSELAILDDNAAKKTAQYLGLSTTGTIGVLLRAKDEGLLDEVRPEIEKIRRNGFWLSDAVVAMALRYADEPQI